MDTKLPTAQEAAIGFARRLRHAGPRRGHRLRQPRHACCRTSRTRRRSSRPAIRRTSAGGSTSLYNAVYIALKDLKKVVAKNAGRNPPAGDRRALGRRRHVEPAAVRGSARPRETVRDGDLQHRPARQRSRQRIEAVQGSRVRAAPVLAGDRRTRVLPESARRTQRASTARSPTSSSSQYTVGYTSKNPRRDGAWRRRGRRSRIAPTSATRTKQGYFGPTH